MLRIYNTLSRRKEVFRPRRGKKVEMFVCGPTVYDRAHIGHGRTFVTFDMVARTLRARGFRVFYLQNITDMDDKIIARAAALGRPWRAIAREFERAYREDMARLSVASVDRYARATAHLPEIISQIRRLIAKRYAYVTPTGVYFHVPAFRDYGKLSRRTLDAMEVAVRIERDPTKRHPADFALWKRAAAGEPSWPSPWGRGRPGWHIEDTAITETIFGPQYDLHGGALDLIFPHHESEIAQMEALSGKKPFVRYWMHAGFITVRGEKMAKSLGNFVTIAELLERWSPEVFRLFVFSAHYRTPLDYDEKLLAQAAAGVERIRQFSDRLGDGRANRRSVSPKVRTAVAKATERFSAALDDDFDTPRALAALFSLIRTLNPALERDELNDGERAAVRSFLTEVHEILRIVPQPTSGRAIPRSIRTLVERRERYRRERRFAEADAIRNELATLGWQIEDTPQGPRVRRTPK